MAPSADTENVVHMHDAEEVLPCEMMTQMNLEDTLLSGISQAQEDKYSSASLTGENLGWNSHEQCRRMFGKG